LPKSARPGRSETGQGTQRPGAQADIFLPFHSNKQS
jgi:hypothetical protein